MSDGEISAPVNDQLDPDCPPILGMREPGSGPAKHSIAEEPGDILQWTIIKRGRGRTGNSDLPPFHVELRSIHLRSVTGNTASESLIARPANSQGTVLSTSWDLTSREANAVFVRWWRTLMEFKARRPSEFPDAPEGARSPVDGMESISDVYADSEVTSANEQASTGLTLEDSINCGSSRWMAELWRRYEIRARQAPRGSVLCLPGDVCGGEQERIRAARDVELMERLAASNPPSSGIVMPGPPNHPMEPRELHQEVADQVPSGWPGSYSGPLTAVVVGGVPNFEGDHAVPVEFQTNTGGGGDGGSTDGTGSTDDESTDDGSGSDTGSDDTTESADGTGDEPADDGTGTTTDGDPPPPSGPVDDGGGTGGSTGGEGTTTDGVAGPGARLERLFARLSEGDLEAAMNVLAEGRFSTNPTRWPLWALLVLPLAAWWWYMGRSG